MPLNHPKIAQKTNIFFLTKSPQFFWDKGYLGNIPITFYWGRTSNVLIWSGAVYILPHKYLTVSKLHSPNCFTFTMRYGPLILGSFHHSIQVALAQCWQYLPGQGKVDLEGLLSFRTVLTSSPGSEPRQAPTYSLAKINVFKSTTLLQVTFRNVDQQFLVMFRVKNKASEEDLLVAVDDVIVTEGSCNREPRS